VFKCTFYLFYYYHRRRRRRRRRVIIFRRLVVGPERAAITVPLPPVRRRDGQLVDGAKRK